MRLIFLNRGRPSRLGRGVLSGRRARARCCSVAASVPARRRAAAAATSPPSGKRRVRRAACWPSAHRPASGRPREPRRDAGRLAGAAGKRRRRPPHRSARPPRSHPHARAAARRDLAAVLPQQRAALHPQERPMTRLASRTVPRGDARARRRRRFSSPRAPAPRRPSRSRTLDPPGQGSTTRRRWRRSAETPAPPSASSASTPSSRRTSSGG